MDENEVSDTEREQENSGDEEAQEYEENEVENEDAELDEDGRRPVVFTEEEKKSNLDRVQFTPAVAKHIISKHSGSILVKEEPKVTLSGAVLENATRVFQEHIQKERANENEEEEAVPADEEKEEAKAPESPRPEIISHTLLRVLLSECGFTADRVEDICTRMYDGPDDMEIGDFIAFFTRFYAPSFYYGQRLRRFVGRGEMEEIYDLLARGCDVNAGDGEGLCSLHYASIYNRPKVISELVAYAEETIVVDAVDRYGWTPLHCACQHGNLDCVTELLKAGANVRIADKNGKTPLHIAACQAKNNIIDAMIEHDADAVNIQDKRGMTPLHDAAFKGHEKTYRVLVNSPSANVEIKDILGNECEVYVTIEEDEHKGESKR